MKAPEQGGHGGHHHPAGQEELEGQVPAAGCQAVSPKPRRAPLRRPVKGIPSASPPGNSPEDGPGNRGREADPQDQRQECLGNGPPPFASPRPGRGEVEEEKGSGGGREDDEVDQEPSLETERTPGHGGGEKEDPEEHREGCARWPRRWTEASHLMARRQGPRQRVGSSFRPVSTPPCAHRFCCSSSARTPSGSSAGTPTSPR
jgi:hypothetical protein